MSSFVHLHTHSEFSLLDGLGKLDKLIQRAKEHGMTALGLTDHGAMYGSFKFYLKAKAAGIKPIIGVEAYMAKRTRFDKEGKADAESNHLVLLAQNEIGYRNLMRLVTIAHLEGFYYKPRIDWEILEKYHEGIIATSSCMQGQVPQLLRQGKDKEAYALAEKFAALFGEDHYYIELQRHPTILELDPLNDKLVKLAQSLHLPLLATNDVHYVDPEDAEAQDILLCVQTGSTILDKNRMSMIDSPDFYLRSEEEMKELFVQYPEAIENSVRIADMCNLTLSVGKWILPAFPIPDNLSAEDYLEKIVWERLPYKYPVVSEELKKRIEYELGIIKQKGYAAYFLIVQDFVNWAKNNGIGVGPGRGSAAGSVITNIVNITGVDPMYFNLPFERFLNPYRPSAPDIDLDFADDRREEVIKYVTEKYGDDKVAQIITFGTMEAKAAIRDAGRSLGMPYSQPDRLAKMIPPGFQGHSLSIDQALEQSSELSLAYKSEPETKRLLDIAKRLEGVSRHSSVHAAGVVIADKPLVEYTPLQKESKGERITTQYDMYTVGEDGVGLLKMDFLGLRNLTIMSEALKFIKQNRNIVLDLQKIPLNDKKTFEILSLGETTGVFQLESAGMRRYIKELRPTSIFDLMAMVALYRPGPIQFIPDFIKRKNNPSLISYPDPRLKDVLKQSYGIIAYQDDVLLTAITLAGYTWGDADKLRKAVGKKIASEMKKQEEKFVEGCITHGLTKTKASEIFKLIEPFAGYGFNKAHAACYAMIAYQTAYLKANFPVEFMTAVLSAESRANTGPARDEKMTMIVDECRRMQITLLPPDINASAADFSIQDNKIRFGLSAIKNVGTSAIDSILTTRTNVSKFTGLGDILFRVDTQKVNRKTLESMIKIGALDSFGNRASLLAAIPFFGDSIGRRKKSQSDGQSGLFDQVDLEEEQSHAEVLPDVAEFSEQERIAFERELLGFYLTAHPLEPYRSVMKLLDTVSILSLPQQPVGARYTVVGIISNIKKIVTKSSNAEMAFIRLEDFTGAMEVVVFPKLFATNSAILLRDAPLIISGKLDEKDDHFVLLADEIKKLSL